MPFDQRISDEDMLHNINTFMFAGSDTSSLSITWMLYLLSHNPTIQDKLRAELLSASDSIHGPLTEGETQSLYEVIANLPYLNNVVRESLRSIPPIHSSIRLSQVYALTTFQEGNCPNSYAYAYDERSNTALFTCDSNLNADYTLTFCPYVT